MSNVRREWPGVSAGPATEIREKKTTEAFTTFVGPGSLYRLTPCSERTARAAVAQLRAKPITVVDLAPRSAALPSPETIAEEMEADDEDDYEPEEHPGFDGHAVPAPRDDG